ncbi:nucleotidyl transferase family protein [Streptacidiphilus sp. PAMC 29251]
MTPQPLPSSEDWITQALGPLARRFTHHDRLQNVLPLSPGQPLAVVTGFGPTNAPTAGTLSVMLGVIELQRHLQVPMTVVVSELGAWNSRNVPWNQLTDVRDQMFAFMRAIGLDAQSTLAPVRLRSHVDPGNLVRCGRIARFLSRQDFLDHHEDLVELYQDHGLLGSEVGLTVDALYTVADILGPAEEGAARVLMLSGLEESYFTELSRLVLQRQAAAGELSLGWKVELGALYFRVLEGLGGYPKMSKSIPASSIHLGMPDDEIAARTLAEAEASQRPLLSAIELSSGWSVMEIDQARAAFQGRRQDPEGWQRAKQRFTETFALYSKLWRECGR